MKKIILSSLLIVSTVISAKMEWSPERIEQAKKLVSKYSVELSHMASEKVAVSAEGKGDLDDNNWGVVFYGNKKYSEFARSLHSALLYQDALNHDFEEGYKAFTEGQPKKITPEQFTTLRTMLSEFREKTNNSDVLEAMIVINDIGKAESVQKKVAAWTKNDSVDHDQVLSDLLRLAETNQEAAALIPNIMKLSKEERDLMSSIWAARLNIPQFAQGECPERALEDFVKLNDVQKLGATLEAIFDVAGAQAHTGIKSNIFFFNLPNFTLGYEKLKQDLDIHEMYKSFYFELVEKTGATFDESWKEKKKITLGRLFKLGRGSTKEYFEKVVHAFHALPIETQEYLIKEMSLKSSDLATGITIMYSPALMQKTQGKDQDIVNAYAFLAVCYNHARYKQLPKMYVFDINDATSSTATIAELIKHPIYYKKHDDGAKLLLVEPTKEKKSMYSSMIGYASENLHWIKDKFGSKSKA